jgi:phosphoribosylformimino-5-aminoimidazole carboxamide ribotide isomerase
MKIYPAIDLIAGQVVRLSQGRFDEQTTYSSDPFEVARRFEAAGAKYLHIVDLDGAREGYPVQRELIQSLAKGSDVRIQTGGGVRRAQDIEALLEAGVARVVIGSLAIQDPELTTSFFKIFGGEHLTLGLDVQLDAEGTARVATHGWRNVSGIPAVELLTRYSVCGLQEVLCTDISKDGMLLGPNFALYQQLTRLFPDLCLLASGGVRGSEDIRELEAIGMGGAIIGKALYEGQADLSEILRGRQQTT